MRNALLFLALALGGAGLDLLTKHWAFALNPAGLEVPIIDGYFSYGKTLNPGIIFGGFTGAPDLWKWISVLAVPAILAIFFSVRRPRWILTISLGMILAGTIGNMYDRLAYDAVRDFIKFYVRSGGREKVWPLFNLADSFICVGVFLLTVEMLFFDEKKRKREDPAPAQAAAAAGAAASTTPLSVNAAGDVQIVRPGENDPSAQEGPQPSPPA